MSIKELTPERHRIARQYLKQYSNCSKEIIAMLLIDKKKELFKDEKSTINLLNKISINEKS